MTEIDERDQAQQSALVDAAEAKAAELGVDVKMLLAKLVLRYAGAASSGLMRDSANRRD